MADQWLSIVEYARCFNISDMTVRRRIKNGKLHAVLKEGKYYIPIADEVAAAPSRRQHSVVDVGEHDLRDYRGQSWQEELDSDDYLDSSRYPQQQSPKQFHERNRLERSRYPQERYQSHYSSNEFTKPTHAKTVYQQNKKFKNNDARKNIKDSRDFAHLPKEITGNFNGQNSSMIETEALLSFCNTAMKSIDESKKAIEKSVQGKVEALEQRTKVLEAQLGEKDQKVDDLKQKIEDFQLLIKIIETAKKNA